MTRLVLEVEFQFYGESSAEELGTVEQLRDTLVAVVGLLDMGVGTFVKSTVEDE